MYWNNANSCCFTEHSKVTAHNRDRQINYIRETTSVSRKAPQGSELGDGRLSAWLDSQHESEGLSSQKTILLHTVYIYIHISTVPSGPRPESMTRSPLTGMKEVSTGLSSMSVRQQLSSVGSVSVNSNMKSEHIRFYI